MSASASPSSKHAQRGSLNVNDRSLRNATLDLDNLSIDDAFADGAEDSSPQFSLEMVRKELEVNTNSWATATDGSELGEDTPTESSIQDTNASVSTIDMNAPDVTESNVPPATQHPSDEETLSDLADSADQASFPAVVIDLTKSPSSQIVITSETVDVKPGQIHTSTMPEGNHTEDSTRSVPSSSGLNQSQLPSPSSTQSHVHRPSRSTTGPSALEKVVSRTRPSYLPPKPKAEDMKHLADWEVMMKQSRAAEDHKRKLKRERQLARERVIEESFQIWEKDILPDWKSAVRDPRLRRLWWNGVPPKLRGSVWEKAIGNALALSKDNYRMCQARARKALSTGQFPTTTLNLINADIQSTLPSLHLFHPHTGPLYEDLSDILCAWVVARSDEGLGYVSGVSKIAAMLLLNMPPPSAFVALRNLLERHCLRSFYGGLSSRDDVEAYYRIFDTLLADCMPKVYFNFKQHQVSPAAYFPDWLVPLFLDHLPLDACARIWDVIVLEGDSFLYRAALAILAVLEPRLFFPDREELLSLLRGQNAAALEVAKREGRQIGSFKYDIYSVDEENVWERVEALEEWWKESTWSRLIQRELPDL